MMMTQQPLTEQQALYQMTTDAATLLKVICQGSAVIGAY